MDFLDDVGGLLVGGAQPAREPPQLATASFVVLGDAQGGASSAASADAPRESVLSHVHALPTRGPAKTQHR